MDDYTQIERFEVSKDFGLSNEQIVKRINERLINVTAKKTSKSYWGIFASNLFTIFNLLGLAVMIALIFVKAPISNFFFVIIYLSNITIGIVQEIRAKISIDKLSLIAESHFVVIRNGEKVTISSKEIVLDDVIELTIGNQVPTDSICIDGEIEVNESLLTGESIPVKKSIGDILFAGSFITSGTCLVKADKVGKDNYVEILSQKAKKHKKPHSELMDSLKLLISFIAIVIVPLATLIFLKKIHFNVSAEINRAILETSGVILGMIPSGMMLLTSVALAIGVIRMSQNKTLVKDLFSLETLARVDVLCLDKTGTITDGNMNVIEVVDYTKENNLNALMSSAISALNDSNQTANALKTYFGEQTFYTQNKIIPFSSSRKFAGVSFNNIGTLVFGACEYIPHNDNKIDEKINSFAEKGLRVLLVALSNEETTSDVLPNNFSPIGYIVIEDNIRPEAIETIKWFKDNDVEVKVISGDNPVAVSEIAKKAGISNADKYVSLEGLSDEQVISLADKFTVFGRVNPEQKAILVKALKTLGRTVAMTGDGVNDILALKESNCAVTVVSGSEAAKSVSHLILMDNNFNSMPKVVFEGRRVINNIEKSASLYLMKTIFIMLLATLSLITPIAFVFTPSYLIFFEMFITAIPSFFLSMQANDKKVEGKFLNNVIKKSLPAGVLLVVSVLLVQLAQTIIISTAVIDPAILNGTNYFTYLQVFALILAGDVMVFEICQPFNKYRFSVFLFTAVTSLCWVLISITIGFAPFGIPPIKPLSDYWLLIVVLTVIVILNFFVSQLIHLVFNKLYESKKLKESFEKLKYKK
ncbi:MAG: HAD family hydrolase [Clostridiales bacterium]|nr:HAD family hydrolase [Clostridiales bacterium]